MKSSMPPGSPRWSFPNICSACTYHSTASTAPQAKTSRHFGTASTMIGTSHRENWELHSFVLNSHATSSRSVTSGTPGVLGDWQITAIIMTSRTENMPTVTRLSVVARSNPNQFVSRISSAKPDCQSHICRYTSTKYRNHVCGNSTATGMLMAAQLRMVNCVHRRVSHHWSLRPAMIYSASSKNTGHIWALMPRPMNTPAYPKCWRDRHHNAPTTW